MIDIVLENRIGFTRSAQSSNLVFSTNAFTKMQQGEGFFTATTEEIEMAMVLAHEAWRSLRIIPGQNRALFLQGIADGIEALGEALLEIIQQETGYPQARIITERNRTCAQLRMFAEIAKQNTWQVISSVPEDPGRVPSPRPSLIKKMMPVGPVAVFGASNFPLAYSTAGGDAASAWCVGCPVIVKAHEAHLQTNALVADVIVKAAKNTNMPDGIFSTLYGNGFQTGLALVNHPLTKAVGFTGSLNGGRALMDAAASRKDPIPVFAEMGSTNPVFVFQDALVSSMDSIVKQLSGSITLSMGQFCTKPGVIILQKSTQTDIFIQRLKDAFQHVVTHPMLNAHIENGFNNAIQELESILLENDSSTTTNVTEYSNPVLAVCSHGDYLASEKLRHEIFGPYALIVLCETEIDFMKIADAIEGQLTVTIIADTHHVGISSLTSILIEKAGRIIFNGVPTGVEVIDAMTHGGPYPASSDSRFTAVGQHAVQRWIRPVTFQNLSEQFAPLPSILIRP